MSTEKEKQPIALPTTVSKPKLVNPRTMVLYGKPKVGKTTAVCKLPNSLN